MYINYTKLLLSKWKEIQNLLLVFSNMRFQMSLQGHLGTSLTPIICRERFGTHFTLLCRKYLKWRESHSWGPGSGFQTA